MQWLTENWFWLLIGVVFIYMHLFGHGGHGSHGAHRGPGKQDDYKDKDRQQKKQDTGSWHGHH